MMQIYLVHDRHGKKIAMHTTEADSDKKNGWKEVAKDVFFAKPVNVEKKGQSEELVAAYEAKLGKKPHHKMTDATIIEALNDPAS